ncbi:hypothetical protein A3F37_03735 [Candidatus Saccharibacteria bacterium RIFCSPHIGHO2_12_FULL_41_12]|nr:MAG: hypothetical protein A3F37_03735 [Candidatus Saccharibacteria bacterium RIFCSPHIGHO2_12_FULL_41_12]
MSKKAANLIVQIIGGGLVISAGMVAPNAVVPLAKILIKRQKSAKETEIIQGLNYAKRLKLVKIQQNGSQFTVKLTEKGQKRLTKINLTTPLKQAKWDGKWRILLFDIPNKKTDARNALRLTMRELGMQKLQDSAWVTPWDCSAQFLAMKYVYGIEPYITLIVAGSIDEEEKWKKQFKL